MTFTPTTLAITGHRALPPGGALRIRNAIRALVRRYPNSTWLAGGAVGADQTATDELMRLGQAVRLILPFPPDVQGARWSDAQRELFRRQLACAQAVEVLADTYDPTVYHQRNRRLVERSQMLVAFWDGRASASGTAATVREAVQRHRPIHWVPMV